MPPHKNFAENIFRCNNPYGASREDRVSCVKNLKNPSGTEVLYWVGCTASLRVPEVAKSTTKILEEANVDYTILGVDEGCCGGILKRTGFTSEFKKVAEKTAKTVEKTGCGRLITSCAGCYRTFKKDYPETIKSFKVEPVHMVEVLADLVYNGRLRLKDFPKTITYHDPCHIGRHLGLYSQPRKAIQAIPKAKFVEMERSMEEARCCGAGGGVRGAFKNLTVAIASERIRDAERVKADVLVTACPFCLLNLKDAAKQVNSKLEILDITELFARLIV